MLATFIHKGRWEHVSAAVVGRPYSCVATATYFLSETAPKMIEW